MSLESIDAVVERVNYTNQSLEDIVWTLRETKCSAHKSKALTTLYKQMARKLDALKLKLSKVGTNIQVVKVSANCKILEKTNDGEILVPRRIEVYYSNISTDDAIRILQTKVKFLDKETIDIEILELGKLNII